MSCWGSLNVEADGPYRDIAAGMSAHMCAIDTRDDLVRCWGTADIQAREAPQVPMTLISAGHNFSCGLRLDNAQAMCWGRDLNDVLRVPRDIAFTDLDSGYDHSCAIRSADQGLTCWGLNLYGQLNAPDGQYKKVSVGTNTACAIKADDTLACWGRGAANENGEFGQAIAPEGTYVEVTVGGHHACAVHTDGHVVCWGAGSPNYPDDGLRHVGQATPPR